MKIKFVIYSLILLIAMIATSAFAAGPVFDPNTKESISFTCDMPTEYTNNTPIVDPVGSVIFLQLEDAAPARYETAGCNVGAIPLAGLVDGQYSVHSVAVMPNTLDSEPSPSSLFEVQRSPPVPKSPTVPIIRAN